jgi:hypothetical protein
MRTRPSPPSPRGDEIFELIFYFQFWLPQTSRLGFPDNHSFSFLFVFPVVLLARIPHGNLIASPTIT